MLLLVGTFRLPREKVAAGRPVMQRMIEESRAEAGCIEYNFAEDVTDAGLIHVQELWSDQASLDSHKAATHFAEWRTQAGELGVSEPNIRAYEVREPLAR